MHLKYRDFSTMRPVLSLALIFIAFNLLICHLDHADASLDRFLRQSGEGEQEATTAKSSASNSASEQEASQNAQSSPSPPRLYPDIPKQTNFVPQFNGVGPHHYPAISHHHGQTPFVPFGIQVPTSRLNADQQPVPFGRVLPAPKPMTPAERLQSESFANGLGRRLLSLIGLEAGERSNNKSESAGNAAPGQLQPMDSSMEDTMKALQNSTILQQLNKGIHSIYGGLSKMYNSTVQEQLDLLQQRFKLETQNSTNPWHQRMAEQVPQFFKQMASKVGEAQGQLNKVWHDVAQAAQGNTTILNRSSQTSNGQPGSFLGPFDQFLSTGPQAQGDFLDNIGRSLGFGNGLSTGGQSPQMMAQTSAPTANGQQQNSNNLANQMREFWHTQVQPQIGIVRNQVARVWRDLTASGAFTPETIIRSRSNNNQGSAKNSTNLLDDILKEVDMSGSEYTLIEAKNDAGEQATPTADATGPDDKRQKDSQEPAIRLSPQMENRLIGMQRELNQLWLGLSNSLQGAIANVKQVVNPNRAQFVPTLDVMASNNREQASLAGVPDSAIREVEGKVKDLSKLQRDADMVHETVQQQQRDTQQRQAISDRFKNFFNNMNPNGVNQLPDRIGQSFNRFGTVVGDLWNQIPERWDNFMNSMRPQQQQKQQQLQDEARAKMKATSTTTTTESSKAER